MGKMFIFVFSLSACVTRYEGKCPRPQEYKGQSVVEIMTEARDIVAKPGEKKAIVFGVYGTREIYLQGIRENFDQATKMYPGWDFLVFVDSKTVPASYIQEMRDKGAKVFADASYDHASARFFVADMPEYDRFIIRDADSRIYPREIVAVADWMKDPNAYIHGMRDAESASDPLQAGMWGALSKPLREKLKEHAPEHDGKWKMEDLYYDYMKGSKAVYGDDQKFLADIIVKSVGLEHFMSHETVRCKEFPGSRGFPIPKGISEQHIGTRVKR